MHRSAKFALSIFLISIPLIGILTFRLQAVSTPFNQTNWVGGGGQTTFSDTTRYLSATSIDDTTAGTTSLSTSSNWYNNTWLYRKKITIDADSISGSTELTNFTFLVSLTSDSNLSSNAQSDGDDLLFASTSGTKYFHEIESYNNSTGALTAWVKIPTLSATTDTEIYLYYGNSSASNQEAACTQTDGSDCAWNGDQNLVMHFSETSGTQFDSTANNNDTTNITIFNSSNQGTTTNGIIAGYNSYNSDAADDITISDNVNGSLDHTLDFVFSFWLRPTTVASNYQEILVKGNSSTPTRNFGIYLNLDEVLFTSYNSNTWSDFVTSGADLTANAWHHIAYRRNTDGTRETILVNGSVVHDAATTWALAANDDGLIISESTINDFRGGVDELRVVDTALSNDWIATEYANQSSPSSTFTLASQETLYTTSGVLTSSIIDAEQNQDWGTLTFNTTTPTNTTATVRIRTASQADMSDADAFNTCDAITTGTDVSSNNCVTDSQRYFQYQITLTSSTGIVTPSFNDITLTYTASATPTPTASPTPTPSPTPTASPDTSSETSSSVQQATTQSQPPSCPYSAPKNAPVIYAALPESPHELHLYFTNLNESYDQVSIMYGTTPGEYPYGAMNAGANGAREFIVQSLQPGTRYYFRINAANNCARGPWSADAIGTTVSLYSQNNTSVRSRPQPTISIGGPSTDSNSTFQPTAKPTTAPSNELSAYNVDIFVGDAGQPIAGATVTLHSTPRTAITDKNGVAHFENVEPGAHKVIVAYNGFQGSQDLTVDGDKKDISVEIKLTPQNPYTLPQVYVGYLILMGIIALGAYKYYQIKTKPRTKT